MSKWEELASTNEEELKLPGTGLELVVDRDVTFKACMGRDGYLWIVGRRYGGNANDGYSSSVEGAKRAAIAEARKVLKADLEALEEHDGGR